MRPIADLNFLVAEDHEFQRNTLTWILAGLGATQVYEAADGHEALKIINDPDTRVDIVISDLEMPGMDGLEFIRHLGQSGNRASIILASALDPALLASIVPMAEAYGIHLLGVIEKPLTPDKLVALIGQHQAGSDIERIQIQPAFSVEEMLEGLRNDEFEPYFQPKIELRTGRLCGVEALARWHHPQHSGPVMPGVFIKPLEDSGHIDELTWMIMRKAVMACKQWTREGITADVSVNLSIKSLGGVKVAERLLRLVESHQVLPQQVIVELTESVATIDVGGSLENIARLRMNGFGLSIDDYGTGYASMQQLTRIAFTELKIDQAFVTGAPQQNSSRVMLESSLDMTRRLGLTSVGEGVESREDLDLLCELGCDMAQGYFIARPMDYSKWIEWARAWKPEECRCP